MNLNLATISVLTNSFILILACSQSSNNEKAILELAPTSAATTTRTEELTHVANEMEVVGKIEYDYYETFKDERKRPMRVS